MPEPAPNHRNMQLRSASTLNSSRPYFLTKARNPLILILNGHRLVVHTSFGVRSFNIVTASLRLYEWRLGVRRDDGSLVREMM